ncbi:hypothetical protein ACIBTV_27575 [Micromonospora sp. NPDC049366]|uniref:hypothetical protein n=1 Tax=Micromonospora sp. NPDC049366 TaxID=3364271 RepID=UPI00378746A2
MTAPTDDPPVRLVLDLSALRAYTAGSVHVGEPIHEVTQSGVRFGVPVAVAYEALATTSGKELALLYRLLRLGACAVLPALPEDLAELTYWRRLTGRPDLAEAAVAAFVCDASVLSSEGGRYGPDVPVIYFPA